MVETTENVSSKFLKWEQLHFNIFENTCCHMQLLGTIVLLIQTTPVLLHQSVKPRLFSVFCFQCILRYPPPCRTKYTWIYCKIITNK